jgi:hypothetical protein
MRGLYKIEVFEGAQKLNNGSAKTIIRKRYLEVLMNSLLKVI